MIEATGLCKYYGLGDRQVRAVDGVDLSVGPADFVAIMGHSGSGKSTLLSLLGGLTRPTSGTVSLDGVDLWSIPDRERAGLRNRRIGFVYQFASLIPTLTAEENVVLPVVFGASLPDAGARATELLAALGMAERRGAYPGQLSGGEQRRVAIARAFINAPAVVLADEPTGDLDEETEALVLEFFRRMNGEGVAFVLVTHSRGLARLGRVQMKMDHGRLIRL
jgi:putative ABC transport system ATP-binding protein/lipoprotein-releasing system ATP-binding protein